MAAATDGFKPSDIAHSLKSKAEHAFGVTVTDPFAVKDIENHRADITYTVTASYTSEPVSRQVQYAAGPSYNREYIGEVLAQRHEQIFSDATYTRDLMQGHLKGNAELYREPVTKHLILSDDAYCYTVEDCRGCNGRGKNDCSTCNGTMYHTCRECNGHARMHCTNCSGTGNTSHNRYCIGCGGSGARMGERCNQCYGTGKTGSPCYRCHATGTMTCNGCNGAARQHCQQCHQGEVQCSSCRGACQLTYEYNLNVYAQTKVSYGWKNLTAPWLAPALKEMMNAPECSTIFSVDRYERANENPNVFVGTGHVVAAQAQVGFQGMNGTCQFIGPTLVPVFLDNILSGGFKQTLEAVKDHKNLKKVFQASSSKIARELVSEQAKGKGMDECSPVRKGIITSSDAMAFSIARNLSTLHILSSFKQFRWSAVFGLANSLFGVLFVLYGLMSILHMDATNEHSKGEWCLGLFAMLVDPKGVADAFMSPMQYFFDRFRYGIDYMLIACWMLAALLFNRFTLPLLAPRLWNWATGSFLKALILAVPSMAVVQMFMALYPSQFVPLQFSSLIPTVHLNMGQVFAWFVVITPQIYLLALTIAIIRYKAAGIHWGEKMMRLMLQEENTTGIRRAFLEKS